MNLALLDNRVEPKFTMNGILGPIIEELLELASQGLKINEEMFQVRLLNLAVDDPGLFMKDKL